MVDFAGVVCAGRAAPPGPGLSRSSAVPVAAFLGAPIYSSLSRPLSGNFGSACRRKVDGRRRSSCVAVVTPSPEPRSHGSSGPASASVEPVAAQVDSNGSADDSVANLSDDLSGALEKGSAYEKYMDLRTLKKAAWSDVRIAAKSSGNCRFGPFSSAAAVAALSDEVLFGLDTMPLTDPQRTAVRALLSRRSVLYPSALPDRQAVVADLSLRANEWKQTIVYCAPTERAAEAMYIAMCASGPGDKNVSLDVGLPTDLGRESAALVITVPRVLRRAIVDIKSSWWMTVADLVVLDDVLSPVVSEWEEIVLGMPSRVLLCIFATELSSYEEVELPLWLETVQNGVVPISPRTSGRFIERIDRPGDAPLAQAYIYNAALHSHPVQLSLPRVLDELEKELTSPSHASSASARGSYGKDALKKRGGRSHPSTRNIEDILAAGDVDFAKSLLAGVEIISAEDVTMLSFEKESHAMYADLASLILADARLTAESSGEQRGASKSRRKTAASLASAAVRRQRRKGSALLPAMMFAHGSDETECAAMAVLSSLEDENVELVYDGDARELLSSILDSFVDEHEAELTSADSELMKMLERGVGVLHEGLLPALSSLAQELFRESLVQVLCVDSHLNALQVLALPRARSILVQSCVLAEDTDQESGLIKGSLLGTLAGRPGIDDVGNIIGLWYDTEVDNAEASEVLAAALLTRELTSRDARSRFEHDAGNLSPSPAFGVVDGLPTLDCKSPYLLSAASVRNGRVARRKSGAFLTTYSGLLGTIRRHGYDGYTGLIDYALDSYRGWLVGASLRATREKLEVQQSAVDQHLEDVRWNELASHDRLEAKLNEQVRMYRAMSARRQSVLRERTLSVLKSSAAGSLIGLCSSFERFLPQGNAAEDEVCTTDLSERAENLALASNGLHASGGSIYIDSGAKEKEPDLRRVVPAVLVSTLDSKRAMKLAITNSNAVALCVLADGMWTLAPVEDVVAFSESMEPVPNVDLIPVPHFASFDKDPSTQWAKCKPVNDAEIARLSGVAEELVSSLTSSGDPLAGLKAFPMPEFEKQEARVRFAQEAYKASPWCGREAQITDFRRLRRRALELADDANSLRASESRLGENVRESRSDLELRLRAKLAVLEDCNAVCVPAAESLEMTPIGALSAVLPSPYPLFASACLLLVTELEDLSVGQIAAFVHTVIGQKGAELVMPNYRQGEDSDMFNSILEAGTDSASSTAGSGESAELSSKENNAKGVLPGLVLDELEEIRSALHVVQDRHFDTESLSKKRPRIAPQHIRSPHARAICDFVEGRRTWVDIVQGEKAPAGELVRTFRACAESLHMLSQESAALGELSSLKSSFSTGARKLSAWPIADTDDWKRLVKHGVGVPLERRKKLSYKGWWERSADAIEIAVKESEVMVERAVAEIVDSVDDGGK